MDEGKNVHNEEHFKLTAYYGISLRHLRPYISTKTLKSDILRVHLYAFNLFSNARVTLTPAIQRIFHQGLIVIIGYQAHIPSCRLNYPSQTCGGVNKVR